MSAFAFAATLVGLHAVSKTHSQAVAAEVQASGSFDLPDVEDDSTVYTATTTEEVAVTITVTAGAAVVEYQVASNWFTFGNVAASESETFEGTFDALRVTAVLDDTLGTYVTRAPTTSADETHIVGEGSVTLSGSPVRVFVALASRHRHILFESGAGSVSVRTTSGGSDIISVEAGDDGYVSRSVTEYWLTGTGTVTFTVLDAFMFIPADTVKTGESKKNSNGDVDRIFSGDGSQCFKVTITNTGNAAVTIRYKYTANEGPEDDVEVDVEDSTDITCNLEYVDIRYAANSSSGAKVSFETSAQSNPE